jgi:hypothetical protein
VALWRGVPQRSREPRFADTGLAGKEHHLTFADLCLGPAPQQHIKLFFASDEGGEAGSVQRLEAAFRGTRP